MSVPIQSLSYTDATRNQIGDFIVSHLKNSFNSTLNTVPNMKEIFLALIYHESSYNHNATSRPNPTSRGTAGYTYTTASAIAAKLSGGTAVEIANITKGLCALGLAQVLGMYFVKGGNPDGSAELQRLRPDVAGPLIVQPGDDITAKVLGQSNASNAVLAGLIILESKYKAVKQYGASFGIVPTQLFSTKIGAAVGGYLGLGKADIYGTTPAAYSNSIVGGDTYRIANGSSLVIKEYTNVANAGGPNTNGNGLQPLSVPGC